MNEQLNETLLPIRFAGEILTVSSLDFAEGLGIQHKHLLETIRNHQQAIESDFGSIAFETEKPRNFAVSNGEINSGSGAGRPQTVAYLTEDQALFVGTLSRNSKRVVEFKATLVKSFALARKQQHQAIDPLLLLTQTLQQQTKLLIEQSQRLAALEQHVALPSLLPGAAETSRQESLRRALLTHVDLYASARNMEDQQVWHYLYNRLYELYKIRIWDYQKSYESLLTVAERLDLLDKLYNIALSDFKLRLSTGRQ